MGFCQTKICLLICGFALIPPWIATLKSISTIHNQKLVALLKPGNGLKRQFHSVYSCHDDFLLEDVSLMTFAFDVSFTGKKSLYEYSHYSKSFIF